MKQNINEHDKTKEMMDIIRNGFKNNLITEAEESIEQPLAPNNVAPLEAGDDLPEPDQSSDSIETKEVEGDTISPVSGDAVFNEELKKIQQTLTPRAEITNFKIYPQDSNVIIKGILMKGNVIANSTSDDRKYSGIYFTLNLANGYDEPEMVDVKGDETTTNILTKFPGYYENFRNEWSEKMSNEYKPKAQ
jgi:hypothetical protein